MYDRGGKWIKKTSSSDITIFVYDASGAVIARHDYLPFGEEIGVVSGRTAGLNHGDDSSKDKKMPAVHPRTRRA